MNERIRELASEARLLTGWPVGEIEYQKFAELIIQECVVIVADAVDRREPASTYVGKIKDHFN